MDFLILFIVFTLGAIIGSFLNVVILRYNTGSQSRAANPPVFLARGHCLGMKCFQF